jgi:Gpi18-like mannosyltransferase
MNKSDRLFIFFSYLAWLGVLLTIVFFAERFFPLQHNFLGGGLVNYLKNPFLWSFGNFDGEHYIAIAQYGYQPLTYFFFPMYPILINFLSNIFGGGIDTFLKSGIFISNISFVMALIGLYKLLSLDFKKNIIRNTILLLFVFPTSFYFSGVYTESLFLAFVVWSLYFARNKKWLFAGFLAALATSTRIVGLALVAAIAVEIFLEWRANKKINLLVPLMSLAISILGIGIYVGYVWVMTGDPFNFYNSVNIFGAQRSNHLILLPQVFYRYFFKILPNLNYSVLSVYFPPLLELVVGLLFTMLSILSFFKIRLSYAVYLTLGFLIPSLSGSFSSLPRYVLVLFPAFCLVAQWLDNKKLFSFAILSISFILLVISYSLFSRGYWIS